VIAKWHELIEAIHNGQTDAVAAKLGAAGALKPAQT
jgi:hypothetical protein